MKDKLIKVIFEYSDGSSKFIETEELKKWSDLNTGLSLFAIAHNNIVDYSKIKWSDYKRSTNQVDKNFKEIFEGDKVKWSGQTKSILGEDQNFIFEHICIVEFDNKEWCGWCLRNLEDDGLGTIPIGFHGAKPNELEVINEVDS